LPGNALSLRAHTDYQTLVREKFLEPLKMNSSGITLSNSMKSRLAVGHNAMLKPVANWDVPGVSGAGALRSTANDFAEFHRSRTVSSIIRAEISDGIAIVRDAPNSGTEFSGWTWLVCDADLCRGRSVEGWGHRRI
jgi:CubicO group peptidase (beta-lactamase class C family)